MYVMADGFRDLYDARADPVCQCRITPVSIGLFGLAEN